MAWSQMVDWGSLWDSALLNTLLCLLYSSGTTSFGLSVVVDPMVTHPRKYWSVDFLMGHGMFLILGT